MEPPPLAREPTKLELITAWRRELLGINGLLAERLSRQKNPARRQMYSLSLLSAISQDTVIAN